MFIKPLTPGASRRKLHFLLILEIFCLEMANLAPIYSKRHLQHDSMPFLPLAPRFFRLSVFFFPYLFAAVVGLASSSKLSEKASLRRTIFTTE